MKMGMLMEPEYHAWRIGRVPYLERLIKGNLSKAGRVLRILAYHARDAGLQPVLADYMGIANAGVVKPALVVAPAGGVDWILCQITSNPYGDASALALADDTSRTALMRRVNRRNEAPKLSTTRFSIVAHQPRSTNG